MFWIESFDTDLPIIHHLLQVIIMTGRAACMLNTCSKRALIDTHASYMYLAILLAFIIT